MTKLCVNVDSQNYIYVTGSPATTNDCPYLITETGNQVIELYPFNLSVEEGAQIASAILALWAVAVVLRILIKMVNSLWSK